VIQPERVRQLNSRAVANGVYVLYWMQASQRAGYNHALEHAIDLANERRLPLVVVFSLIDSYPEANLRHYTFMLEGLRETFSALRERGIAAVALRGDPEHTVPRLARRATLVVTDRGYTRHQRAWRERVAERVECPVIQVETDAIVPVEVASPKEEYAAATLRPKIGRVLLRYMVPLSQRDVLVKESHPEVDSIDLGNIEDVLATLPLDRSVHPVPGMTGGEVEARRRLGAFLQTRLQNYNSLRNNPSLDVSSGLSPYLHFGQMSPLEIALEANERGGPDVDAFLEELIVRRELALNFTFYNQYYDTPACLPGWATKTLEAHALDPRPYLYDCSTLEAAQTHDAYWNAAQREMLTTGKMHNYMRMYWGKKILEWSGGPETAYGTALYLNNRWQFDGRDPNSYAGVAWCFGKHDRPWAERPIFGKVRYMNSAGLDRKFDMKPYVNRYGEHLT